MTARLPCLHLHSIRCHILFAETYEEKSNLTQKHSWKREDLADPGFPGSWTYTEIPRLQCSQFDATRQKQNRQNTQASTASEHLTLTQMVCLESQPTWDRQAGQNCEACSDVRDSSSGQPSSCRSLYWLWVSVFRASCLRKWFRRDSLR